MSLSRKGSPREVQRNRMAGVFQIRNVRLTDVARTGKVRMWWLQICFVVQPYLG